jgi:hypothetical protein
MCFVMCGFCGVWVFFDNCVGVLVIHVCVLVLTVLCIVSLCTFIPICFVCTVVSTTATE